MIQSYGIDDLSAAYENGTNAGVAKLADATDSKSVIQSHKRRKNKRLRRRFQRPPQ